MNSSIVSSSVLVQVSGPDPKQLKTKNHQFFVVDSGYTTLSCSGFLWDQTTVITSAWLLAPFIKEDEDSTLISGCQISCVGEDGVKVMCKLVKIHRFTANTQSELQQPPSVRGISSIDVAVLRCSSAANWTVPMKSLSPTHSKHLRGTPLVVVSSAFGLVYPKVFRNSVTKGVLCNVLSSTTSQATDVLYFTDARCMAGSEGAPVFLSSNNQLVGMVLPPLLDRNGQKFELSCILPISLLRGEMQEAVSSCPPTLTEKEEESPLLKATHSVALLRMGDGSWGSGVIVHVHQGKALVLTCAHVVVSKNASLWVQFRRNELTCRLRGMVLFVSTGPIDVALVEVHSVPSWVQAVSISRLLSSSSKDQFEGEVCSAIGFSLFEPNGRMGTWATVSTGNICKAVTTDDLSLETVLFQTCTPVFRGHSGGMLSDSMGRLLGIVTSNAKHSNGSIIPEINFAIPYSLLAPLVASAIAGEEAYFDTFNRQTSANLMLKSIWGLTPPPLDESKQQEDSHFFSFFRHFRESRL